MNTRNVPACSQGPVDSTGDFNLFVDNIPNSPSSYWSDDLASYPGSSTEPGYKATDDPGPCSAFYVVLKAAVVMKLIVKWGVLGYCIEFKEGIDNRVWNI